MAPMIHERVDIKRWIELFPLSELRAEARRTAEKWRREQPRKYRSQAAFDKAVRSVEAGGEIITSPFDLAVVEQLRTEASSGKGLSGRATDVFVFAKGEPAIRAVTKVGGLPFWPRSRAWPRGGSGKPMAFVAQFCFADSQDVVPKLPGEVMLIFADGKYGEDWWKKDSEALRFEWLNTTEAELVSAADLPETRWDILPCYGAIHRTMDVPDVPEGFWDRYNSPWRLGIFEGTKIGGVPQWIQGEEDIRGQFLCALGSIQPVSQRAYPYVNVPEPLYHYGPKADKESDRRLMWGDLGSLYIFAEDGGTVHWTIQCY